jgi:hypothetical protein
MTSRRPALRLALALVVAALLSSACITRTVRETAFEAEGTEVILRAQKRAGRLVDKGYAHPITIAPVRLAHILSRIDMRRGDGKDAKRIPAIPLETLYLIADGLAKGLAKAGPAQEVVIQSIRRDKRFGVFDRFYLTSLLCYAQGEFLYVHLARSDWEIPARRAERLPEAHIGEHPLDFRLIVDTGMSLVDHQSVAVDWRDDIFKKPTRTRITPSGKVVRRTVLMETLEDETDYGDRPHVSEELTPAQLRALANLEEQRQNGEISEADYQAQRMEILTGGAP